MAATTVSACGSMVAAPVSVSNLSSAAAFGVSQAQFAPVRNVNARDGHVVAVTASYSQVCGLLCGCVQNCVVGVDVDHDGRMFLLCSILLIRELNL